MLNSPQLNSRTAATMTLSQRIQRVQGLRRRAQMRAVASTAGWMAGSAGLALIAVGGFLSLR